MIARFLSRYLYWFTVVLSGGMVAACTMVDLPPVPPPTTYKPARIETAANRAGERLLIAIPENRPPYFDGIHGNGLERDIIAEAFRLVGHHPEFMEAANRKKKYESPRFKVECVSTVSKGYPLKSVSYFSEPLIAYHYVPFFLKKSHFILKSYHDFAGKNVEALGSSRIYMGEEFTKAIPTMLRYAEHENRTSQVALLLSGSVDILVMDRLMFQIISRRLINDGLGDYATEIVEAPIDKSVDFSIACHHEKVIEAFNKGLAMLRSGPSYQDIFKRYVAH